MSNWIRSRSAVLLVVFVASLMLAGCQLTKGVQGQNRNIRCNKCQRALFRWFAKLM